MKRLFVLFLVVALLATTGCAGMSARQQRALSGGAIGAAGGGFRVSAFIPYTEA